MTVNNPVTEVTYVGDGSRVDFPIAFDFIDPIQVLWTPAGGSVIEDGADNWIVRMDSPPADGAEVRIYRDTPITQETEYRPYDAFPAESTENALDKLTEIAQELENNKADKADVYSDYVKRAGDTMKDANTGIDMNGGMVTGLPDPVANTDAVNKKYYYDHLQEGPEGPVGPIGPEGPEGPRGPEGPEGPKGDPSTVPGPTGPEGPRGPEGPEGPKGAASTVPGPEGPQGPPGAKGDKGDDSTVPGPDGPRGPEGPEGPEGPRGPEGPDGPPGTGIQFKGTVATSTALPGWPNSYGGEIGDAYATDDTKDIWVWGDDSAWHNLGQLEGPHGPEAQKVPKVQKALEVFLVTMGLMLPLLPETQLLGHQELMPW